MNILSKSNKVHNFYEINETIQNIKEQDSKDPNINQQSVNRQNSIQDRIEEGRAKNNLQDYINVKGQVLLGVILGVVISLCIIVTTISLLIDKSSEQFADLNKLETIVQRNYQTGQVFHQGYVIRNQYENLTVITSYDLTIAAVGIEQNLTRFVATLLKKSEQKIQTNGNSTYQLINQDNPYLDILVNGGNETQDNNTQTSDNSSSTQASETQNLKNSSNFVELANVIPIFEFSLKQDGKVQYYNFPINIDLQTLGLFRSAIKLFSPLIDKKAYTGAKITSKRKLKFDNRNEVIQRVGERISLGNSSNNTENQTAPDSVYEELNNYDFASSDDRITLNNTAEVNSQDQSHSTSEIHTQSNQFDENGRLLQGSQTSNTEFSSPQIPPDQNSSVVNFNLSYSSKVSSEMKLIFFFEAFKENILKFQGLFLHYHERNETLKVDPTGLANYIIGLEQNNEQQEQRLLLQDDGSLSLLKYMRQQKVVQTNILGCQLGSSGYIMLNFNLYQDSIQQFKKIPKFTVQAGVTLKLGFSSLKYMLVQHEKQLPPLSLKFTLEQIQIVMDLIKGDFVGKLKEISQLIASGQFDSDLLPNILKVLNLAEQVSKAITTAQNQNTPSSIIEEIFLTTNQIKNAIDTQGTSLLNPQNQFISTLSDQLLTFVNMSYSQALGVFNLAKSTFSDLKTEGQNFFSQMQQNFIQNDSKIYEQRIRELIPQDVYLQYENQMKIAKDVLDFIDIVEKNGTDYMNYIESTFVTQKNDFLMFVKGVVDLFFRNQTIITDSSFNIIMERFSNISEHVNSFRQLVFDFDISKMHNKITDFFSTILLEEFQTNQYLNQWNARIQELQTITYGISAQKGGDPCCSWDYADWLWEDDECEYYNNAYGDQRVEHLIFKQLSQGWTTQFKTYSSSIFNFSSKSINIINNSSIEYNEKYEYIKQNYTLANQSFTVNNINELQGQIDQRTAAAKNILSRIGCGGRANLNMYITKLQSLKEFLNSFKSSLTNLSSKAQNFIDSYSKDVYSKLRQNFVIIQSVDSFLNSYEQKQSVTKSFIYELRNIVSSYNAQQFAKSSNIMNNVTAIYQKVKEALDVVCSDSEQQKIIISQIRKEYQNKLNIINSLSNNLLNDQLIQIKQFLIKATNEIYEEYIRTSFCSHKQKFINEIATLNEDINNMTAIYTLYKNMTKIINKNKLSLEKIVSKIKVLSSNFYKLFTPEGYRSFIANTSKLTQQIKSFVYEVSIDYSTVKQEAQSIYVFQMAPKNDLTAALQLHTSSPFTLKITNVFTYISQYVSKSYNVVDKLSFDIITVVVIAKDVLSYFQQTVNNFENGIQNIQNQFSKLCQDFLNLQETTGQDYINNINRDFYNLLSTVNYTIFPGIGQKMTILNRYQSYRFSDRRMQLIRGKCFSQLSDFAQFAQSTKSTIFSETKKTIDKIKQIIGRLEIGTLNQIYVMGIYIKDQFSSFISYFRTAIDKISDYKNEVARDLRQLFKIGEFFNSIKNQTQMKYTQTVSNIKDMVTQTMSYLQNNQYSPRLLQATNGVGSSTTDLLAQFKNSTAFSNLQKVGEKLINNFTLIWDSLRQKQSRIAQLLKKISNDSVQLIEELGSARQKFANITNRIQERIRRIKNQFQSIRRKLTNIQSLIFVSLKTELGGTIRNSMQNILKQVDDIFNIDFRAIQDVDGSTLKGKIPLIDNSLVLALDGYTNLVPFKEEMFKNIFDVQKMIDEFLEDSVAVKMQKLKQGMIYVKSVAEDSYNPRQLVLFSQQLYNKQVPIFQYRKAIITAIGIFVVSLDIDYRVNINANIILYDFRSVQCKVVFEVALLIEVRFCYFAFILQFGLYIHGEVVKGQIVMTLAFQNIVPLELTKSTSDIAQMIKSNLMNIYFAIDLAIYAVSLEIGFYIAHLWIQLIWIRRRFCIRFGFFKFCIRFRIPIGFKFVMKRHNFGYRVNGVPILEKRIFKKQLLEYNY